MLLEYDELIHLKGSESVIAAIDEIITHIEEKGATVEKPSKLHFNNIVLVLGEGKNMPPHNNILSLEISISFPLPFSGGSLGKNQNDSQENVQRFV